MPSVAITGWTKGCNTVLAIKQIREKVAIPLNEALAIVNRVLDNHSVVVDVATSGSAMALAESLMELGLVASTRD